MDIYGSKSQTSRNIRKGDFRKSVGLTDLPMKKFWDVPKGQHNIVRRGKLQNFGHVIRHPEEKEMYHLV